MPLVLELVDVSYAHLDSVPLLSSLRLRVQPGWTAVVGANGVGKTTLLRLIHGELLPDAGRIRCPGDGRSVLCEQRVDTCSDAIRSFSRARDGASARWRGRLALEAEALDRWDSLSPGERKRWQLGAALAESPPLLLLDEPTNHLDAEARALVLAALREHRGVGLVVSHDRELLARLTAATIRVAGGGAELFAQSYSEARRSWQARERRDRATRERWQGERRRLRKRLTEQRARRDHADARTRTSRRMKGPRDNATAGGLKMSRRRSAVNALGRDIRKLHGALDRLDRDGADLRVEKELGGELFVDHQHAPPGEIARVDLDTLAVGDGDSQRRLLRDVRLALWPGQRVWLHGPNGSGKSSLLAALREGQRAPADRVLWMPQEIAADEGSRQLEALRGLPPERRGRRLQIVAALGADPDSLLASPLPSPGEARKLLLAEALDRQVWALVLDEPTNHLDLPSLERLERALHDYPGALLLVTHDAAFARALTGDGWRLGDGRVSLESAQPEGDVFR